MILPIYAYGTEVLRKETEEIEKDYPDLKKIIENMFETMYAASGVGLAAPQIGISIRLFIVDASPFAEDEEGANQELEGFKKVFVNPIIVSEEGEEWAFAEGCLSIPDLREDVFRQEKIKIEYYDEKFKFHQETYDGFAARILQHEYDHLEGVLFTDHLNPLRKRLIRKKLQQISKGDVDLKYKMKFPSNKKHR